MIPGDSLRMERTSGLGTGLELELNLAPVIDCLTVLIGFVMISASFAGTRLLDVNLGAGAETTTARRSPPVKAEILLAPNGLMRLAVSGQERRRMEVRNASQLTELLTELKRRWPELNGATVVAQDSVDYRSVVSVMDTVRRLLPAVTLGGF